MNKFLSRAALIAAGLILASCTAENSGETDEEAAQPENTVTVDTTDNQLSDDYYTAVIVDGQYQTSQTRGASLDLNSLVNMKAFESGLLDISKGIFPTDQYYFQEGQVIDSDTALAWIDRYAEEDGENGNPMGLNPAVNTENRTPMYLEQIIEQDYMTQTEDGYQLGGISIGLAMNSVDYYKDENGNDQTQEISDEELEQNGKAYAATIIERIRGTEGLEEIPIVIGIFKQTDRGNLAGGTYVLQGVSSQGTDVEEWTAINNEKVVFPLTSGEQTEESSAFDNFRTEVQRFFPNLNGVTGVGEYEDGQLMSLDVDIMVQFYGTSEIISFTQHVADVANTYLPQNIKINIQIESIEGMESFLSRDYDTQTFDYHIFD